MITLNTIPFDCPRTCPQYEPMVNGEYWCRFNPIFRRIGRVLVHSHTATIKCEYTDAEALRRAVENMGGIWYGFDKAHDLHDTTQEGLGFRLPMKDGYHKVGDKGYWYHPLVARADGQLAFDSYGGAWGDVTQLETLKQEYVFAAAQVAAEAQGWLTEKTPAGELVVHHPSGGTMTIAGNGQLTTAGFTGGACHEARQALGLPVDESSIVNTAEFCQVPAVIQEGV